MMPAAIQARIAAIEERIQLRDYGAALDLVRRATSKDERLAPEHKLVLDILAGECLAFLGKHDEAIALSSRAARELRHGENHSLYARACFTLSVAQRFLGDLDQATENINLALFSFKRADDRAGVARSLNWLGNIAFDKGDYRHSLTSYAECVRMARQYGMPRWVSVAGDNIGRIYLLMGKLREARNTFEGNREALVENSEQLSVLRHDLSRAYLEILDRRFPSAETILRRIGSDMLESLPPTERGVWCEYMGELELCRGNLDEAETQLTRAIRVGEESGPDESMLGQSRRLLAEVFLAQGNPDTAATEIERALKSIRVVGERFEEGAAYRVLGECHTRCERTEEANQAFRKAVEILGSIGAHLELAKTRLAAGRYPQFSLHERLSNLFEAERLFGEIGVAYWIDETRAALQSVLADRDAHHAQENSKSAPESDAPVIITKHAETLNTLRMAECWAREDLAILITGETGTGKDLLARYVRWMSSRRHRPFVTIDLNTVPDSLWESELFGYRKGTFTGAAGEKAGLLETADGGTVFLNEIGNLPLSLQAKLLEFLDTRQVRRLGDSRPRKLDVRLIAATNSNLTSEVDRGTFRADLFYRLEQAPLHLLPLRHRREDFPPLLERFLTESGVSPRTVEGLLTQPWVKRAMELPWKGNIRELRHFAQRLVALAGRQPAMCEFAEWAERLIDHMPGQNGNGHDPAERERTDLMRALAHNGWNQRAAARELQVSEGGVRHMMRRHRIERPLAERLRVSEC